MAARTFRKIKQQQIRVFFGVIFLCLTWITEKEPERVIENKGDEFRRKKNMEIQSSGEKMRNASGRQGENERQWKIKANMNTCHWYWYYKGNKGRCKESTIRGHRKNLNPIWGSDFFCVLLWLILYISLYFLYNMNTGTKILGKHIRQFLHKNNV